MKRRRVRRPFWTQKLGQMGQLVWESHALPMAGAAGRPVGADEGELAVMFLGHSSFLLQFGNVDPLPCVNVLIDPVFATRLVVLRRMRHAGVKIADLPAVDMVLLTHAHMDHLNRPTLRRVARATRTKAGHGPVAVVPAGVEDLVRGMGFREVRSLKWWESTELNGVTVTLTPAKHWGARLFTDTHRLFGGYVLADAAGHRVYHSGDTAYFDGFAEIGRRLTPQVLCCRSSLFSGCVSRGAYESGGALPRFVELGSAETMVPMHLARFGWAGSR